MCCFVLFRYFYLKAGWEAFQVGSVYTVRVLWLSGEEESLCADKLPVEYSVAPEASHGPRGRDSGRERGRLEKQCDRVKRGCIGCLNSSKSRGSVCVCGGVCVRMVPWPKGVGGRW